MMKISEVKEGKSRKRGKVGLRVVARATHQYYEGAGVCAVQVRCVAVRTRRRWLADLASCDERGEERREGGRDGKLWAGGRNRLPTFLRFCQSFEIVRKL